MITYRNVTGINCQSHVHYLLELSDPKLNRTVEPLQPIAFSNDSDKKLLFVSKAQCKLPHWTKVIMMYRYTARNQFTKTWISEATLH